MGRGRYRWWDTLIQNDAETLITMGVMKRYHRRVTPSPVPILGIPACGMYHKITIFDLILPRVLAGEKIGRKEFAELGHGAVLIEMTATSS